MSLPGGQSLVSRLVRRLLAGQLMMAAMLFIPAGSFDFGPGWGDLAANLISQLRPCFYFYQRDPQRLERRLLKKEIVGEQKLIHTLWRVLAAFCLSLAGCDYRFGWSDRLLGPVPWWLTLLAWLFVLGGYTLVFQVLKANRFAASVVQVEAGQAVADTGTYRFVRHPMYSAALLIWFWTPLALGSYLVAPVCALILPILVFRLQSEEKILRRDLPGYVEYCQRTRYRLVPLIW